MVSMKRSDYRKKKKRRGLIYAILFVASLVLLGGTYWVYQYNSGRSMAEVDMDKTEDVKFEPFEGVDPQFGEINVLLIGNDARDGEEARSDALMIGHYDQTTNAIKIVSLMRDTYVEIPGHGQQKLNAAYFFGGPELVRKTIKQNFDVDVQYYAIVDFTGFSKIVDIVAPDGIQVDIPYPMSHGIGMTLESGEQTLNGEQLLGYVRFRHDIHSDFGRVERQQEALSKLKDEAISFQTLLNLPKLLGLVNPYIDTNIDNRILLTIGKGMIKGGKSTSMESLRIPIENSFVDKKVAGVGEVLDLDVEQNKEALRQFLDSNNHLIKTELEETEGKE